MHTVKYVPPKDELHAKQLHWIHGSEKQSDKSTDKKTKRYVVVWRMEAPKDHDEYLPSAQKGDVVVVEKWMPPNDTRDHEICLVRNGKEKGLLSPFYLLPKADFDRPNIVNSARWFVGKIGPIEASTLLDRDGVGHKNWCIVCDPPEYASDTRWPELLLLVRTYTGGERTKYKEWNEQIQMNPKSKPPQDRLPTGSRAPMPVVAYLRICRRDDGRYYIFESHHSLNQLVKATFNMIDLPIDFDLQGKRIGGGLRIPEHLEKVPTGSFPVFKSPEPPVIYQSRLPDGGYGMPPTHKVANMIMIEKPIDAAKYEIIEEMKGQRSFGTAVLVQLRQSDAGGTTKKSAGKSQGSSELSKLSVGSKTKTKSGNDSTVIDQYVTNCDEELGVLVDFPPNEPPKLCLKRIKDPPILAGVQESLKKLEKLRFVHTRGHNYLTKIFQHRLAATSNRLNILFEWAGDLQLNRLMAARKQQGLPLPIRGQLEVCYQVAAGMRYLEENNIFHGQLSGSNVQVRNDIFATMTVKVCDYYIYAAALNADKQLFQTLYKSQKLQWRHMSPESHFDGRFTIKSDVWSFGVFMAEVFAHGKPPFEAVKTAEDLAQRLREKSIPLHVSNKWPTFVQQYIKWCVYINPNNRPKFARIFGFFNQLLFDAVKGPNRALLGNYQPHAVITKPSAKGTAAGEIEPDSDRGEEKEDKSSSDDEDGKKHKKAKEE